MEAVYWVGVIKCLSGVQTFSKKSDEVISTGLFILTDFPHT